MDLIPCKECLVYAICKYRESITCSLLYEWIHKKEDEDQVSADLLQKTMPNWLEVSEESKDGIPKELNHRIIKIAIGNQSLAKWDQNHSHYKIVYKALMGKEVNK